MKVGETVQVYGDGPHDPVDGSRGPERVLWLGEVASITPSTIIVRPLAGDLPRRRFAITTGRALNAASAEFLKLDVPEAVRLDPPPPDPGPPVMMQSLPSSHDLLSGGLRLAERERDEARQANAALRDRDLESQAEITFQRARGDKLSWWLFCAVSWAVVATALALRAAWLLATVR